ncbi:hypothetical protein F5144DRAFT_255120 [Chaetomium tenue]|uniref:Uncharacterized protein n=1 Tax=Chaetomium tenue TaxID=1854479 RepID=A0ACB7PEC9_9PEZI|nr:hypothetical protein F5144DRAFT_255120 [Chaetomium globosum]
MRQSVVLSLVAAGTANAAGQQLVPGIDSGVSPVPGLLARQFDDCTIRSTCHGCFGDGYVVCDKIGCFNPEIYQQCCHNARLCVAKDNSCCSDWGGPGETGTSGVPNVTAAPTPMETDVSYYSCTRGEPGEDCCQRAQPRLHWCSGEFPSFGCYNNKNQFCCTDGTICDQEGCCELFDASTTHPWAATATTTPSAARTQTTAATNAVTEAPTSAPTSATDAPESTTTTSGAGRVSGPGLAMGLVALALFFL